jgi:hypothetical protein
VFLTDNQCFVLPGNAALTEVVLLCGRGATGTEAGILSSFHKIACLISPTITLEFASGLA